MDIALRELWHIGLFQAAFCPGSFLCYIAWTAVLIGALIQWLLLQKAESTEAKWAFAVVLLIGLFVCEVGYQSIIGFEQVFPLLSYWLCLFLLSGAGLSCLLNLFLKQYLQ